MLPFLGENHFYFASTIIDLFRPKPPINIEKNVNKSIFIY